MFLQLTIKRHPVEKIDPSTMLAVLDLNRATVTPLSAPPRNTCIKACRASVTIRLLTLTPAQRVSRISAETDDLAKRGRHVPGAGSRIGLATRRFRGTACPGSTSTELKSPQRPHCRLIFIGSLMIGAVTCASRQIAEVILGRAHLIGVPQRGAEQPLAIGLKRDHPLAL